LEHGQSPSTLQTLGGARQRPERHAAPSEQLHEVEQVRPQVPPKQCCASLAADTKPSQRHTSSEEQVSSARTTHFPLWQA